MIIEINARDRNTLIPLFRDCQYDRVLIESVLEGNFGSAYANRANQPTVARLDSGAFTLLGGNPSAVGATDLLHHAPICYVTPQNDEWQSLLQRVFDSRISVLPFTDFSFKNLDPAHLAKFIATLPSGFALMQIDKQLAERLSSDIGNEFFFENFHSIADFLGRGVGFCILHEGKIVSAATSMAQSSKAIDIEIETLPDFRQKRLGTVVGAKLVLCCLEHSIEPHWLAANSISEKLALKLGYVRRESYETYEIQ